MPLLASTLEEAGARSWIWAVVGGLLLSGVLIGHGVLTIARAFPAEVRANTAAAVRRHPRLLAVCLFVAAWTTVYALYSLAYPHGAAVLAGSPLSASESTSADDGAVAGEVAVSPVVADNRSLLPPSLGGPPDLPTDAAATISSEPEPRSGEPAPPRDDAPPPEPEPNPEPEPEPCPAEALAEVFGPGADEILCPEGSTP